ncbi:MAG: heme lyase CcmF/NrfE family subunit [Proteobacteria bacterium]|nr:heme lyase CcmF/NrfE family subunit [Pseudomonadota bacterium]
MPESSAFNIPHSPIAAMGTITLLIAYLVAAYGAATGLLGNVQHRRRLVTSSVYALYGFFALMLLASALMIYAFVTHDYTIKYVAQYSDTTMPIWYKITAYWGGLDGSLMFWVAVLAAFSAVAVWVNRHRHRDMIGYVVATILLVQIFFLSLLIFTKNPFATYLTNVPTDGEGLNPLLQNYWMVIHPPSLYLGFVAATIPFAFGMAALASGRLDDQWLGSVRSWMLICWFFLSLGLILGGRWAYEELGWGGYWAWDPVENAGFLPWFTAAAFLHSVLIQEQRGMMKLWNLVLVIVTFFLTIFGTFMTRSGIVQSVHAFGQDNELALQFVLFMALILVVSFGLLIYRVPKLRASNTFESFISREFAFLLNNWILLGCALFVLFATMYPTIWEAFNHERVSPLGPEFYNKLMTPAGLALLFLAGAAPLLAWRRTTSERLYAQFLVPGAVAALTIAALALIWPETRVRTPILVETIRLPIALVNFGLVAFVFACITQEFYKGVKVRMRQSSSGAMTSLIGLVLAKRRKYGGYVVHLAVAVMFVGFAGKAFESMEDFTVQTTGETFQLRDYTFEYNELHIETSDHKTAITAEVSLYANGEKLDTLFPAKWKFQKSDQPTTEVSMHHLMAEDVYLILTGYRTDDKLANFRVYINPLINWVWMGFGLLIVGTAICLLPQRMVDSLSPRRRARAGHGAELAILLLVVAGVTFGFAETASAQSRAPAMAEHTDTESLSTTGHNEFPGAAGMFRPNSETAAKLMKELICQCGGCTRENLYECRCGFAANERNRVLQRLAKYDLSTEQGRKIAYEEVLRAFIDDYGGEHVLSTPSGSGSWLIPYVAIGGGLLLLYGLGRRWVERGQQAVTDQANTSNVTPEDEEYAEILDDELRDTD